LKLLTGLSVSTFSHRTLEHLTERRTRQRRRVEEHRIDSVDGAADLVELEPDAAEAAHGHAGCHACRSI
jgi:hypothetical protein